MPSQAETATLVISRDSPDDIGFRGLELQLDGSFLANIDNGKTASFEIPPGSHTIRGTNSLYARKDNFEVRPGETVKYQVANTITALGKITITLGAAIYRVQLKRLG